MLYLSRYPFFRILPAFITGIVLYDFNDSFIKPVWISLLFILVLFTFLYRRSGKNPFNHYRTATGVFIFIIFIISGYISPFIRHSLHTVSYISDTIDHYYAMVVHYQGNKNKHGQYIFNIKRIHSNNKWILVNEKVWVYLPLNDSAGPIPVNSRILVKGHPVKAKPPIYKGLFDFRKYLKRNDISCIHYLNPDDLLIAGYCRHHSLLSKTGALRRQLAGELQGMISGKKEYSLAAAMLLGDRSGLDTDLRKAYSAAGVAHILAVSGLHTGIVFLILSTLLLPMKFNRKFRGVYYLAVIAGIWFYALLTGLSPSVIRASLMFTIVMLGLLSGGKLQVYNSIAAAAFFMLLFEPWLIYSVSFQLSFVAVFGIVLLYPKLNILFQPKSRILEYIWKIICVSVAAQIALFPLLIHYFHQFSPFFILSNILIIPAATLILTFGMTLLTIESIGFPVPVLNHFFQIVLQNVNGLVFKIESLPGSVVDGLHLNTPEVWLVYLLLTFLITLIYSGSGKFLIVSAIASVITGFVLTNHIIRTHRQKAVVVYQEPRTIRVDFIRGNNLWTYRYKHENPEKSGAAVAVDIRSPYEIYRTESIFNTKRIHTSSVYDLVVFEGKRFLFLKRPIQVLPKTIEVDYLFICIPPEQVPDIPNTLHFKYLVSPHPLKSGFSASHIRKIQNQRMICLERDKALQIKL